MYKVKLAGMRCSSMQNTPPCLRLSSSMKEEGIGKRKNMYWEQWANVTERLRRRVSIALQKKRKNIDSTDCTAYLDIEHLNIKSNSERCAASDQLTRDIITISPFLKTLPFVNCLLFTVTPEHACIVDVHYWENSIKGSKGAAEFSIISIVSHPYSYRVFLFLSILQWTHGMRLR